MELNICYQFCLISFMLLLRRKKSQQSALSFSGLTVQAVVHIHSKVPKSRIHSVMYCDLGVGKWNHFPKSLLLLVIVTAIEGELRYMTPPSKICWLPTDQQPISSFATSRWLQDSLTFAEPVYVTGLVLGISTAIPCLDDTLEYLSPALKDLPFPFSFLQCSCRLKWGSVWALSRDEPSTVLYSHSFVKP